jgi:hypothetical protein
MKSLYLILGILIVAVVAGYFILKPETGTLVLQITDAPAINIEKAEIIISAIAVHMAGAGNETGWTTVVAEAKTFDLIAIKDVKELLGSKELTPGKYTQIRLSIDSAKVTINGTEYTLEVPSDKIKLVNEFDIVAGQETTLTLDFDAQESIKADGKDVYKMTPTIKVIEE